MNVMIDLETLSVRPHAIILVIGAIKFKRTKKYSEEIEQKNIDKLDTFYRRITINSCIEVGLHKDEDTVKWWSSQNDEIKHEALINPDRVSIQEALQDFSIWFNKENVKKTRSCIWGNGSDFDISILGEAYKRCNMEIPWNFWLVRDLRTILDIGNIKMCDLPQTNLHNALYDCYRQIIGFQRAMKNLKLSYN